MQIEIAESLIFSWLRHVRGCAVTQMNWKPSPRWAVSKEDALRCDFERIRALADEGVGVPIFKKCDFAQFVRQCEIDVLGWTVPQNPTASQIIAVDSAFHEGGLNYGSADETVGRVLKKLIRAAFAIEAYLNTSEVTIVFATPKVAEPIRAGIEHHLAKLDTALANRVHRAGSRLRFRLIANGDFAEEILQPVLDVAGEVADTSELFLRAGQLMALCERPVRQQQPIRNRVAMSDRGAGIGAHVSATMRELASSGRLTPEIVSDLSGARYSKMRFNLGHPFLKRVDPAADLSGQRHDGNGYSRYWKQPLMIGGDEFLMCSQWFAWQRTAFDQWVRELASCERSPRQRQQPIRNCAAISDRGDGIGAHVRSTMAELAKSGRLTSEIVSKLSSARYSKTRFNLGHPFLKPLDSTTGAAQRRDHNGYARYWKQPLQIGGHQFLMCHEWFDRQRIAFDQWVRDLG